MAIQDNFYDPFNDYNATQVVEPYQHQEFDRDESSILSWLQQNNVALQNASSQRMSMYSRYNAMYKNLRDGQSSGFAEYPDMLHHRINKVYLLIEDRIAQNARLKHNLEFIPTNDEQKDIENAKLCKMLYDAFADESDLEGMHQSADRVCMKYGTTLIYVGWSELLGDSPDKLLKLKEMYPKGIPRKALKDSGIKEDQKTGDVDVRPYAPNRFFIEPHKEQWKDVNWVETWEYLHQKEVEAMYPGKSVSSDNTDFYQDGMTHTDEIRLRTFWHRPTKFLPNGVKIVYCDSAILSMEDFPFDDGELPFILDRDIEVENEVYGRSFLENIEQLQRFHDNIQSSIASDYAYFSQPKFLLPARACTIENLANGSQVIEYSGPQAPSILNRNFTPPQALEIQDRLDAAMKEVSRVTDLSKGNPPSGVTANAALRFLDEQQSEMLSVQESKRKKRNIRVSEKILSRMRQYYSDDRVVRLVGENNAYMIDSLRRPDFTRVHRVRSANSSALPDSKAGKMAWILDIQSMYPADPFFSKEQIASMLELGNETAFNERTFSGLDMAKYNLSLILSGQSPLEIEAYDDLFAHYQVFMKFIQGIHYKRIPQEIKDFVKVYMTTLEQLMFERAMKIPSFAQKLSQEDTYPLFAEIELPIAKIVAMQAMDGIVQQAPDERVNPEKAKQIVKNTEEK